MDRINERLRSESARSVQLALSLLEMLVKNCGLVVCRAIDAGAIDGDLAETLVGIVKKKESWRYGFGRNLHKSGLSDWLPQGVAIGEEKRELWRQASHKVLEIMQLCVDAFLMHEGSLRPIFGAYKQLRQEGYDFPRSSTGVAADLCLTNSSESWAALLSRQPRNSSTEVPHSGVHDVAHVSGSNGQELLITGSASASATSTMEPKHLSGGYAPPAPAPSERQWRGALTALSSADGELAAGEDPLFEAPSHSAGESLLGGRKKKPVGSWSQWAQSMRHLTGSAPRRLGDGVPRSACPGETFTLDADGATTAAAAMMHEEDQAGLAVVYAAREDGPWDLFDRWVSIAAPTSTLPASVGGDDDDEEEMLCAKEGRLVEKDAKPAKPKVKAKPKAKADPKSESGKAKTEPTKTQTDSEPAIPPVKASEATNAPEELKTLVPTTKEPKAGSSQPKAAAKKAPEKGKEKKLTKENWIFWHSEAIRKGQWPEAWSLLSHLKSKQLQPDAFAYTAVISACKPRWPQAVLAFAQLEETCLPVGVVSFGAATSACERAAEWQPALGLLAELQRRNIEAWLSFRCQPQRPVTSGDIAFFRIHHGQKASQWQWALQLLQSKAEAVDRISYNAAISACEKAGEWQWALFLFGSSGLTDLVAQNALISACEKGDQWQQALEIFSTVHHPDTITFSATISACEKARRWQHALAVLDRAREARAANVVSYNAAFLQDEMEVKVLEYMRQQNRPYNAQNVFDNLHGAVPKGSVQTIMESLVTEGKLLIKEYGKIKVFLVSQSLVVGGDDATALQQEVDEASKKRKALGNDLNPASSWKSDYNTRSWRWERYRDWDPKIGLEDHDAGWTRRRLDWRGYSRDDPGWTNTPGEASDFSTELKHSVNVAELFPHMVDDASGGADEVEEGTSTSYTAPSQAAVPIQAVLGPPSERAMHRSACQHHILSEASCREVTEHMDPETLQAKCKQAPRDERPRDASGPSDSEESEAAMAMRFQ
eukprot:g32050.t1